MDGKTGKQVNAADIKLAFLKAQIEKLDGSQEPWSFKCCSEVNDDGCPDFRECETQQQNQVMSTRQNVEVGHRRGLGKGSEELSVPASALWRSGGERSNSNTQKQTSIFFTLCMYFPDDDNRPHTPYTIIYRTNGNAGRDRTSISADATTGGFDPPSPLSACSGHNAGNLLTKPVESRLGGRCGGT